MKINKFLICLSLNAITASLFMLALAPLCAEAQEEKDAADPFFNVGISKYAVLETTFDHTPLRVAPNADSERYTHLKKGVTLFADEQNSEFYKLDLGKDKPFWVEKRYVEAQGVIPEKRGAKISKIKFYKDKKNYLVKIDTEIQTSYKIYQKGNSLVFELYDVDFSTGPVEIKGDKDNKFTLDIKKGGGSSGVLTVNYMGFEGAPIYGYGVQKEDNALVFKIRKPLDINEKKPLKGVKIAIDPGHGGDEKGAVSGGIYEKDLNLQIAKKLNRELKKRGAKTVLTRKKDVNKGLYERVDFANKENADILISVHQNSLPNPNDFEKRHGSGVYYYNENAKKLAGSVLKNLVDATGFKDDGLHRASFALTRPSETISILVECGYIIHPGERAKLSDKDFQKTVAKAIANGVEEYLK